MSSEPLNAEDSQRLLESLKDCADPEEVIIRRANARRNLRVASGKPLSAFDETIERVRETRPDVVLWAEQFHGDSFSEQLAIRSMWMAAASGPKLSLEAAMARMRMDMAPCHILHGGPVQIRDANIVLAAADKTGVLETLMTQLRFSIVESNGCVSILESGRLLCSMPAEEWKKRLGLEPHTETKVP